MIIPVSLQVDFELNVASCMNSELQKRGVWAINVYVESSSGVWSTARVCCCMSLRFCVRARRGVLH